MIIMKQYHYKCQNILIGAAQNYHYKWNIIISAKYHYKRSLLSKMGPGLNKIITIPAISLYVISLQAKPPVVVILIWFALILQGFEWARAGATRISAAYRPGILIQDIIVRSVFFHTNCHNSEFFRARDLTISPQNLEKC